MKIFDMEKPAEYLAKVLLYWVIFVGMLSALKIDTRLGEFLAGILILASFIPDITKSSEEFLSEKLEMMLSTYMNCILFARSFQLTVVIFILFNMTITGFINLTVMLL